MWNFELAASGDQPSRSLRPNFEPKRPAGLVLVVSIALTVLAASVSRAESAIDTAIWSVISATVAAGDIEGMAATYHPDAVLVSATGTVAITEQLVKWGEGMESNRRAGRTASVAFRFESRQHGESTAFERGLFRYAETDRDGLEEAMFVPFEALLVKKDGRWLMLMERQLEPADEHAWDALAN